MLDQNKFYSVMPRITESNSRPRAGNKTWKKITVRHDGGCALQPTTREEKTLARQSSSVDEIFIGS